MNIIITSANDGYIAQPSPLSVLKKIDIGHNFWTKLIGFYVFFATIPICCYQLLWPRNLDLDFWHTFEKTSLILAITFEPKRERAFIFFRIKP